MDAPQETTASSVTSKTCCPTWVQVGFVVAWVSLCGLGLWLVGGPLGVDGWFHLTVGQKMMIHGPLFEHFPWVSSSTWTTNYFDKEWLFHLILGLLSLIDLRAAPVAMILLINGFLAWTLTHCARQLWPRISLWLLLLIPLGTFGFANRMLVVRPHIIAVGLTLLCLLALVKRRKALAACLIIVYSLSHASQWQVIGMAFLADLSFGLFEEDGKLRDNWKSPRNWFSAKTFNMTVVATCALAVGTIIHPHFPNNIRGLWLQNVEVLVGAWQGGEENIVHLSRPGELRPMPLGVFAWKYGLLILGLLAALYHTFRVRPRHPRWLWVFGAMSFLYLLMSLKSMRFAEFMVPVAGFSVIGYALHHGKSHNPLKIKQTLFTGVIVVFGLVINGWDLQRHYHPFPLYTKSASLIRKHLEPGELVFTTNWGDTPMLFHLAPEQRYLVFLDPMFMYRHDPKLYETWDAVRFGKNLDPVQTIKDVFGSRCVFINAPIPGFNQLSDGLYYQLQKSPLARRLDSGPSRIAIFLLDDKPILPPSPWPFAE